jgi:hypothetical protein
VTQKDFRDKELIMAENTDRVEQFTPSDLLMLRSELFCSNVDSFQAAQIVTNFLAGRGYGISSQEARTAASNLEGSRCSVANIQAELARVARVM